MLRRFFHSKCPNSVGPASLPTFIAPSSDVKPLSAKERYLQPFWSTSQERWFIKTCIKDLHTLHVIVSGFRGCGKTTTLARLQSRFFLYAWFPFRQVEFFDAASVQKLIDPIQEAKYNFQRFLNSVMKAVIVFVLACTANSFLVWVRTTDGKPRNARQILREVCAIVEDEELPSEAYMFAACLVGGVWAHRFRRRVLIFDDVTVNTTIQTATEVQRLLARLRSMEMKANVIFVTSNEALDQLMHDKSSTTRDFCPMPHSEPLEMLGRLDRMGLGLEGSVAAQEKELKQLNAMYGTQLAYSARFHTLARRMGMDLYSPSRGHLRQLCEGLILEAAQPIHCAVAIPGSALVKIDQYVNFPLGGCITKDALKERKAGEEEEKKMTAPDYVRMAFPGLEEAPHRLIIPLILLATAHVSNDAQCDDALFDLLREKLQPKEDVDNGLYKYNRTLLDFMELNYFRSLLGEDAGLLDGVLSRYGNANANGFPSHPMIFRLRRLSVFEDLRKLYAGEKRDPQDLQSIIGAFTDFINRPQ